MATVEHHRPRHLDWEGCFNVRDLGGLRAAGGAITRRGAAIRADAVTGLTAAGWDALLAHGVRTVIDLRNEDEVEPDRAARPESISTFQVPLDGMEDREFWDVWQHGPQFGTPLYYLPHLERFPDRSARVLAAIAEAPTGGVVFHCGGGRDRAGQISMLLLALVVSPTEIAADYALSADRLSARYAARSEEDQGPLLDGYLKEHGTTATKVLLETLTRIDVAEHMLRAGLTGRQTAALRGRMLATK
jgi:protein-tyrosine phosphatase